MKPETVAIASMAMFAVATTAHAKQGDTLVRLRVIAVAPNERSGAIEPGFPTERVSVDNSVMPEVDFTYMFTDTLGAELILATTKHHVKGRQALKPLGNLAGAWVLPPTLTLQYHFPTRSSIHPYVGAGLNYTVFYSEKASSSLEAAIGSTSVHLKNSLGYVLQAGVDVDITPKVFVNFDIKYIDIDTKARLASPGGINTARVNLDPIVAGAGIGMRF